MIRALVTTAAAFAAAFATLCTAGAQDEIRGGLEIVRRAAATYEANARGVFAMQRHFTTMINAGIVKHTEASDSGLLLRDGAFVRAKYYRIADDGRSLSAKQIDDRDAQTNAGWSQGKIFFKEPYDPRFMGDYTFAPAACPDCRAGTVAVSFASAERDAQHGAGTMTVEIGTGRVERLTYVPNALPPHATSGRVVETSQLALPDLWYVTRIEETYEGRAFMLKGTGTFTATFDHFQRFASVAEGDAAVRSGTIGALVSR